MMLRRADEQFALTLEKPARLVALAIAITLPLGYFALAHLEFPHPLRGALSGTALMALLGALVGGTAYAALRILPLHALARATAALHQEQEYWKFALEGGGDAVWERNVQTGKILHSKRYLEMFGFTGNESASVLQDWESRIHPDDLPHVKASQRAYLDGKTTLYMNEHRLRCKNGSWKWVLTRGMVVSRDAAGKPLRIIGAHTDITERKQAEEARAKLAAIVENSNDAIFSRTLDGTILSWNAGAERMFGYSAAETIGKPATFNLPPGRQPNLARNNEKLLRGEVTAPHESSRMTRDGRMIDVLTSHSPLRDHAGNIVGASVILHDISALKQAQAERANLAAIVENANDAIIGRTLDGKITSWNAAAERMFGYSAGEAIGQPLAIIMPGPHNDFMKNNESLLRSEIIPAREKVRVTKDGRLIDVTVSVSPVKNESGEVVSAAVIVQDLSERKRAEAQILKLNAELERRVADRTRQLVATNKELEAFSYSVSHDLRAPLRGIDGFSRILLQSYADRLDETASDYLQRIRRAALRMGELIDDLLNLSRVSRAKVTIETVDLSRLARSILKELGEREPQRKVATEVQDGVVVDGDPRLLRIVLENLLGNAWKFTGKRKEAKVLFGAKEQDGEQTVFVKDNGAGFDIKYAHKLFGAFQRLHGATEFEGTGIGLATVQRVINLHGGRVWANSTFGKGATFYFVVPRALRHATATARQGAAA